jgi:aspartyl-tRNA(Asn)/glutamyl-tRNA(Gln) amidotransferase subunit A
MTVIAGHDPKDPTSARVAVPDYEAGLDGDLRGIRVGVPETYFLDEADAPVIAAFESSLTALKQRGATIVRMKLPHMDAIQAYVAIVSRVEGGTIHAQWMRERAQDYAVHISSRMFAGYAIPGSYYVEALARRGPILKSFAKEVFGAVHVLASPTIKTCLPTLAETDIDAGTPDAIRKAMGVSTNTRPFNYLGLPAISVPCGFDPNGLPISLQIAAKPFAEGLVLKVGDAFQRETDFHAQRPSFAAA